MTLAPPTTGSPGVTRFSPAQLLRTAALFAADPDLGSRLPAPSRAEPERRWVELDSSPYLQIWLISWPAGTSTGWHDHDRASGAFLVVEGALREQTWSPTRSGARYSGSVTDRDLAAAAGRAFGSGHIHNVLNAGARDALSVHLYTPRLDRMTRYALTATGPQAVGIASEGESW